MNRDERSEPRLADYPLFLKALRALRNNYSHFLKLKSHPELSMGERRLLEAKYLHKRKRYRQTLEVLKAVSGLPRILEAHRKVQLFQTLSILGQPIDLKLSRELCDALKLLGDESGYFTSTLDLAINLGLTGSFDESLEVLDRVRALADSDWQRANWLRCRLLALARKDDTQAVAATIRELSPYLSGFKPFHARLCHTAIAYALMLTGDLETATQEYEVILTRYRSADTFTDRFWYLLLRVLISDESLRPTPASFREREFFFLRYNIVRNLQCGELGNAERDWSRLVQLRPDLFRDGLKKGFNARIEYQNRTAFGRCVQKLLTDRGDESAIAWVTAQRELPPMVRTLGQLLAGSRTPLRRPQLIEMIYGQPYAPELDSRFYKLIEYAKRSGLPVRHRAGSYSLDWQISSN